jgi:ABC-type branched-subunit amino acid transport system substrate-binding protein
MRRLHHRIFVSIVVLALVAGACGDDDDAATTEAPATTAAATTEAPATTAAATTEAPATTTEAPPAADPVPGVTDDTITVGLVYATSGPFVEAVADFVEGFFIWAEDVNARGGIYGRQVVLKTFDHGETADGGVAACQTLLADDWVFLPANVEGTIAHITSGNCMDAAGRVNVTWQTTNEFADQWTSTYTIFPTPERQGEILAHYVAANTDPGEAIGLIELNADIYKLSGDAFLAEAEVLGLNIVDVEAIEFGATTVVPQLTRLMEAGATSVAVSTIGQEAIIFQEAVTLGFEPQWFGVHFMFDWIPQSNPGVYDGVKGVAFNVMTNSDQYQDFAGLWDAYSTREAKTEAQLLSYGEGLVLEQVLLAAGPNPTLESLEAGIQTITDFATGIIPSVTWGPDRIIGGDGMHPVVCCNPDNSWMSVEDWVFAG